MLASAVRLTQLILKTRDGLSAAISIAAIRAVFDYYQAELPHHVLGNLGQIGLR